MSVKGRGRAFLSPEYSNVRTLLRVFVLCHPITTPFDLNVVIPDRFPLKDQEGQSKVASIRMAPIKFNVSLWEPF